MVRKIAGAWPVRLSSSSFYNFSPRCVQAVATKIKIFRRSFFTRKNVKRFIEVSKNLARYTDLKIILLDYQNNYVRRSNIMSNAAKSLDVLATSLSVLHNYFDDSLTIFSDPYL